MSMNLKMTLLSILAGAFIGIQSSLSGQLGHQLKNPLYATFTIFAFSTFFLIIFFVFMKSPLPTMSLLESVPKHLWFTGSLLSIIALSIIYWQMPQIGVAPVVMGVIVGQIVISIVASHFGWFNLPRSILTLEKMIGIGLVLIGLYFINGGNK